jgi:hypothetical protein
VREREGRKGPVYWDLRHKTFCTNSDMLQRFLQTKRKINEDLKA